MFYNRDNKTDSGPKKSIEVRIDGWFGRLFGGRTEQEVRQAHIPYQIVRGLDLNAEPRHRVETETRRQRHGLGEMNCSVEKLSVIFIDADLKSMLSTFVNCRLPVSAER